MAMTIDRLEREVRALARVTRWRGRRVLEIGCGDGRLTLRLARLGASVTAVEPDAAAIRAARRSLPARFEGRVVYRVARAQRLPYRAREFDCVVFAWAL